MAAGRCRSVRRNALSQSPPTGHRPRLGVQSRPHWLWPPRGSAAPARVAAGSRPPPRGIPTTSCSAGEASACGPRPPAAFSSPQGTTDPSRRRRPGRFCPRVVATAIGATTLRPGRAPLMRFSCPLQRSLAAPRCPVLPASGRSRCGVPDPPRHRTRSSLPHRPAAVTSGPVAGRSLPPLRFSAYARVPRRRRGRPRLRSCPDRHGKRSGAGSNGSCTGGFSAHRRSATRCEPSRDLAGATSFGPCGAPGVHPSRCCSRPRVSGPLDPSDPPAVSPDAPPDPVVCWVGRPAHPTRTVVTLAAGAGRGSWASSPQAVRATRVTPQSVAMWPDAALGFSSLRFSPSPAVGTASGPRRSWDFGRAVRLTNQWRKRDVTRDVRALPPGSSLRAGPSAFEAGA